MGSAMVFPVHGASAREHVRTPLAERADAPAGRRIIGMIREMVKGCIEKDAARKSGFSARNAS
jgi:hypothetical protein